MPDVTGSTCGLCGQPIERNRQGAFCPECSSAFHHMCYNGPPAQESPGCCTCCGIERRVRMHKGESKPVESEHAAEGLCSFAALEIRKRKASTEIASSLTETNVQAERAALVVKAIRKAASKAAGKKNMLFGALWCIGGIIVTAVSYQVAKGLGGGEYVIAWGAMLLGAIQFLRGYSQYSGD
jgi:hypothetical protein